MRPRLQFSITNGLLALTCIALAIGWWATRPLPKPVLPQRSLRPSDAAVRELPVTIAASEVGNFANGFTWYLSVNSAGAADLTIENSPKGSVQRFSVSEEQLDQLRELLISSNFFSLADDYGELVPDGSTRMMTVTVGDYAKTVHIHFLMNWIKANKPKLQEPARAVVIWDLIRGWFQYPEAVDTRKYDQIVLDAVKDSHK